MKWTKTRLKKYIERGGKVILTDTNLSSDSEYPFIRRINVSGMVSIRGLKQIDKSNIEPVLNDYWVRYALQRIQPNYYICTYRLNLRKHKEMKANALDSKNAD